jgi:hypothetical protein
MKRSEMVKIMSETWIKYCKDMGPDNASIGNACDHLLKIIEERGMTPPFYVTNTFNNIHYFPDRLVYTWEPENE